MAAAAWRSLLLLVMVTAVAAASPTRPHPPPPRPRPRGKMTPHTEVLRPRFRRDQALACYDDRTGRATCSATCNSRCPNHCIVLCPGCTTYCECDFFPGVSCGDPRFTGGDGNNFYFHGRKDQNFCIVSDKDLHVNAHFIGKRNPTMRRDFTWIQALGVRFDAHRLYLGARKTPKWDAEVDRLELAFDGTPVDLPEDAGATWSPAAVPGLTVARTAAVNSVRVRLEGVLDVVATVVPITEEDSRVHNYGVTDDDSLAHLDLGFKFLNLTDDVHGVLGQTYRTDYVNRLDVSAKMPVMGGAPKYVVSDIFATDCAVTRFREAPPRAAAGISMVTARAY